MPDRSVDRTVRNPVLALPAALALAELPWESRKVLRRLLGELGRDARARAEKSWATSKAPMAAYWRAVAVYARHARAVMPTGRGPRLRQGDIRAWLIRVLAAEGRLAQDQRSLTDQLEDLERIAVLVKMYDAADWLRRERG